MTQQNKTLRDIRGSVAGQGHLETERQTAKNAVGKRVVDDYIMTMHNPPHPGSVIREEILDPLGLSISETARRLDMNRNRLSQVLHGRSPVTPEIAIRLEMAFKPPADSWLRQQAVYDLWQARRKTTELHITPFDTRPAVPAH